MISESYTFQLLKLHIMFGILMCKDKNGSQSRGAV